ncbi:MAG: HPr family phosphocarrier protein [Blastocatellia bacterium]|nr:HPr family phosphocarrier protein [Blastocatellia bacterium]
MRDGTITIVNRLGLHARAAAQLVRLAGTFKSRIVISRTDDGIHADAKSILSVLTLAAAVGTELLLVADGLDEEAAFTAVAELVANRFGESQ